MQHFLEHRVRFELTVLRVCNPFPWASRASVHSIGGRSGIRTHGPFTADSFQDCFLKPDSDILPYLLVVDIGYDPIRSSPSDQSPGIIRPRRTPVLSTIVWGNIWGTIPYYDFHRVGCEPLH